MARKWNKSYRHVQRNYDNRVGSVVRNAKLIDRYSTNVLVKKEGLLVAELSQTRANESKMMNKLCEISETYALRYKP